VRQIVLTQGQTAIVDDDDFERLSERKWNAAWSGSNCSFYAQSNINSEISPTRQRTIIMHREIMRVEHGYVVDHINRNTLDNRRCNLRICDRRENALNRNLQRNNKSGFKGVKKHTQCERWMATVQRDRMRKYLGLFESPIEAAEAYDDEVVKLHGEFAVTNHSLGLL
jgi:HNH endonuclease